MFDSSFGLCLEIKTRCHVWYRRHGSTVENLAEMYNISREDQDKFALNSQQKAAKACRGRFDLETVSEIPKERPDHLLER